MINLQLLMKDPDATLVKWASHESNPGKLVHPLDRPWFQLNVYPIQDVESFQIPCKCKQKFILSRYRCTQGINLYIGQCPRCQTIVWTYRGIA